MENSGIDYGKNTSANKDEVTGIRYGIINANDVMWFAEESEPNYEGIELKCSECNHDYIVTENIFDCPECGAYTDVDIEPLSWVVDINEIQAEQCGSYISVFKSDFFTYVAHCSPCYPGAGDLSSPLDFKSDDNRAYCFGPNWFNSEDPHNRCPYAIYEVATGKRVG